MKNEWWGETKNYVKEKKVRARSDDGKFLNEAFWILRTETPWKDWTFDDGKLYKRSSR